MIKIGDIIKHKNFMDVACLVVKRTSYQGGYSLRVEWLNQGFIDTYRIGHSSRLKIRDNQLEDWLVCLEKDKKCIRYSEWKQFKKQGV